jgi:UDP-N-acetylglucosamine-lysosomal-enzyme
MKSFEGTVAQLRFWSQPWNKHLLWIQPKCIYSHIFIFLDVMIYSQSPPLLSFEIGCDGTRPPAGMRFMSGRQLAVALVLLIFLTKGFPTRKIHDVDDADNVGQANVLTASRFGPIDAVYTWVNGSDPIWKNERDFWYQHWIQEYDGPDRNTQSRQDSDDNDDEGASTENHFRDNDELRYSFRSLERYAPWIRHIHLVTNGQIPSWLDLDNPRIKIVRHSEIFENSSHLPVFSSSSIESNLDRIPGLSDIFLYFNDDVFLAAPISPDDYITPSGEQTIYLSHPVPLGDDAYPEYWSRGKYLTPEMPESTSGRDADDYRLLGDVHGEVTIEQLLGKALISSTCELEPVIPESLLSEVFGANFSLGLGHNASTLLSMLSTPRISTSKGGEGANTTGRMPELDTKSRIKIAALLDVFSQCPKDHDLVADAIRSVIKAFNRRFNLSRHLRRVPSHMPHMINKHILSELKGIFMEEFQLNSAHRFRHPHDLQVSFAYFDYLINRPYFLSSALCGLRDKYHDMNCSNSVEDVDMRILASFLYGKSPPLRLHDSIQRCLHNGSGFTNGLQFPTGAEKPSAIYIEDVERCIDMAMLRSNLQKEKGYRLKMGNDVTFHMLRDDYQTILDQLQSTRDRQTKFICLNDDMTSPSTDTKLALRRFFEDLWPGPSTFELQARRVDGGPYRAESQEEETRHGTLVITILLCGSASVLSLLRVSVSWLGARRLRNGPHARRELMFNDSILYIHCA